MGKLLCRIGLHKWRVFNGRGYEIGKHFFITYDKECRRCGKTDTGSFA